LDFGLAAEQMTNLEPTLERSGKKAKKGAGPIDHVHRLGFFPETASRNWFRLKRSGQKSPISVQQRPIQRPTRTFPSSLHAYIHGYDWHEKNIVHQKILFLKDCQRATWMRWEHEHVVDKIAMNAWDAETRISSHDHIDECSTEQSVEQTSSPPFLRLTFRQFFARTLPGRETRHQLWGAKRNSRNENPSWVERVAKVVDSKKRGASALTRIDQPWETGNSQRPLGNFARRSQRKDFFPCCRLSRGLAHANPPFPRLLVSARYNQGFRLSCSLPQSFWINGIFYPHFPFKKKQKT
jgi:hypothetical protein